MRIRDLDQVFRGITRVGENIACAAVQSFLTGRRFAALVLALLLCALGPGTLALAQETGKDGQQPQVVEPKAGEAVPPPTTTAPGGPTGPDAPVTSQGAVTGPTGPTGPGGATTGETGQQGAAAKNGGSDDTWLLITAIVLGALALTIILIRLLWRWRGWDPRWLRRWRHANAEAGWRLSLGWAEFRDFLRLGR